MYDKQLNNLSSDSLLCFLKRKKKKKKEKKNKSNLRKKTKNVNVVSLPMQLTYSKPWYGRYNYTIICKYQIHWNRLKNMKVKVGGVTANLEFLIENQRGLQITDVWTQLCSILVDCACSLSSWILISQSECPDVLCSFIPVPGELVLRMWNGILGLACCYLEPSPVPPAWLWVQ